MKWIKRIVWSFTLFVVVIAGAGYLVARIMEKDVTNLVVNELNKNLLTSIQASNVRFSFLRKFPKASIEFRDVVAMSPKGFNRSEFKGQGDTLFRAGRIFLEFNLRDLIRQKYRVQNIQAVNGKAWILTSSDNTNNYIFWKSPEKLDSSNFSLEMQNVRLNGMQVIYDLRPASFSLQAKLEKFLVKGSFSSDQVTLHITGTTHVQSLKNNKTVWIEEKKGEISLNLEILNRHYTFDDLHFKAKGIELSGGGSYDAAPAEKIDLVMTCPEVELALLGEYLPGEYQKYIRDYTMLGKTGFTFKITGNPADASIRVAFTARNAGFSYPGRPRFENIRAKGTYDDPAGRSDTNSVLDISEFSTRAGGGDFSGRIKVFHPGFPHLRFAIDFDAPLTSLQQLTIADSIYGLKGDAKGSLTGEGSLTSFSDFRAQNLADWEFSGAAKIYNGYIEDRSNLLRFEKAEGKIYLGENLHLEDFSFLTGGNAYRLNVEIADIIKWLVLKGQLLKIRGNVYSPGLTFSFPERGKTTGTEPPAIPFIFPDSLYLDLDVAAGSLSVGRLQARKISGSLSYQPTMFTIHSMNLETMQGSLTGGAVLLQRFNKDILFRTQTRLDKIDINKLFYTFYNFGQNELTDKHLKGSLTGNISMQAEWDKYLRVKEESILAETALEIDNGELIQFEPMKGLSNFIELTELEHIYFSKLKNEIFIRNRTITIPGMDINSSAFNLRISGTHTFDNAFTYNVQVSMSEVLAGKARKARKENQEFGIVEPDDSHRTSLFLVISGTFDDYKVNYDARSAVKNIKTSLSREKTTLRNIFREEFGKKNNDSIPILTNSEKKKPLFNMEFDGIEKEKQTDVKKKTTKEPAFRIEWEENESDSTVKRLNLP
ncbi:MAG: AsmA-like C-terminal region-containing protein [Bacteroidales bacterium]